jgi:hypothetical protein
LITAADQVQIYEAIMADTDGAVTYTLLRGARYAKDNRLLPSGFNPVTAHADVAVYGTARFDRSFTGGSDEVTYSIELPQVSGPLTVTARLLYQPASYRFVRDLRAGDTPAIEQFGRYYDAADKTPTLVGAVPAAVKSPSETPSSETRTVCGPAGLYPRCAPRKAIW